MNAKQKNITEKEKEEEYQTPLDVLMTFLRFPNKIYRAIYIHIVERRLSSKPLLQNEEAIAYLAQQVGIEPALMSEKIRSMIRMKWIELEQVGNRDVNQIFVLSPVWHYKPGIDKAKFAISLQDYRGTIKDIKEHQMSTEEIYTLMMSICPHTREIIDGELCMCMRWPECETCTIRKKEEVPL